MKAALLCLLLLTGCASIPAGVQIDDDEAKACEQAGCRVWTEAEFRELMNRVWKIGYEAGRKSL